MILEISGRTHKLATVLQYNQCKVKDFNYRSQFYIILVLLNKQKRTFKSVEKSGSRNDDSTFENSPEKNLSEEALFHIQHFQHLN